MAQVALAWVLAQPAITAPIIGATRTQRLDDAIAAVDLELADADLERLSASYSPRQIAGHS